MSGTKWPSWTSHKIVRAVPIVGLRETADGVQVRVGLPDGTVEAFEPTEPHMARRAELGGYAVIYEDGYRSISPRAAFEGGYTLASVESTPAAAPAHVYAAEPDARQGDDVTAVMSLFRPRYRALTPDEIALHDRIKDLATDLCAAIEETAPCRYRALSITALEEAAMWAIKGLTQ